MTAAAVVAERALSRPFIAGVVVGFLRAPAPFLYLRFLGALNRGTRRALTTGISPRSPWRWPLQVLWRPFVPLCSGEACAGAAVVALPRRLALLLQTPPVVAVLSRAARGGGSAGGSRSAGYTVDDVLCATTGARLPAVLRAKTGRVAVSARAGRLYVRESSTTHAFVVLVVASAP
jgi:hypothetical protein